MPETPSRLRDEVDETFKQHAQMLIDKTFAAINRNLEGELPSECTDILVEAHKAIESKNWLLCFARIDHAIAHAERITAKQVEKILASDKKD